MSYRVGGFRLRRRRRRRRRLHTYGMHRERTCIPTFFTITILFYLFTQNSFYFFFYFE